MNLTKKIFSTLFFVLLISNFLLKLSAKQDQEESIYSRISGYYLNSFNKPTLTQEEIDELKKTDPKDYKETFKKFLKNKKNALRYKKIILELFEQNQNSKAEDQKPCFLNDTLWRDLEIFCGEHTLSSHLLSKINRTQTHSGTVMLAKMLVEPTTNVIELQKRQNIIRELVENENLFKQLNSILSEYAAIEDEILSFWDEKNFNTLFTPDFYFPSFLDIFPDPVLNAIFPARLRNMLNQKSGALEALSIANSFNSARSIVNELYNTRYYLNNLKTNSYDLFGLKQTKPTPDAIQKVLDFVKEHIVNHVCSEKVQNVLSKLWYFEQIGWNVGQISMALRSVEKISKNELHKFKVIKTAYFRLKKAALMIESIKEIKQLIDSNSGLKQNINFSENLKYLFEGTTSNSEEFDNLLNLLKAEAFNENSGSISLIFSSGKILAASFLMIRTQDNLVNIMQALGQIDAYVSLAKLYKETQSKNAIYSFAKYVNQQTPYLNIKEFWTPFINPEKVVTNNLELGRENGARNIIISGPNAGGKSTILKSIMINLLFAQSIGIVPAKELTLTPFVYLDTYLNITDDISSGNSLFKSEVLRIKGLLETIKTLHNIGFCFVIMDEIFSGTNPIEGEAAGYAIGKYISKLPHTIALIASHFPKITNLEQDTSGIFKNYKVTVDKKDSKTLSYPFKFEEGKTSQTIAINILEAENFDPEIINSAYGLIKQKPLQHRDLESQIPNNF